MKDLLLAHAKAVTAFVTALLLLGVQKLHLGLSPDTVLELGALLVTVLVYAVPNKQPTNATPGTGGFKAPEDTPTKPYGMRGGTLMRALVGVVLVVLVVALAGCLGKNGPTPAETGAIVRDCQACTREVTPIVQTLFSRCGSPADAGAD